MRNIKVIYKNDRLGVFKDKEIKANFDGPSLFRQYMYNENNPYIISAKETQETVKDRRENISSNQNKNHFKE